MNPMLGAHIAELSLSLESSDNEERDNGYR
jgi:hypothetical protein